jgi:hypothetical protein
MAVDINISGQYLQNGVPIGGGGESGIHSIIPGPGTLFGGVHTSNLVSGVNIPNFNLENRMYYFPYVPNYTFTTTEFVINVITANAAGLGRICIYDNNVNVPLNRLYESVDISFSTTGLKTITANFNFEKGKIYWFGFQANMSGIAMNGLTQNGGALPICFIGQSLVLAWGQVGLTFSDGAPAIAGPNTFGQNVPLIRIK